MPFIHNSTYKRAPRLQFNGHLQTIVPALGRRLSLIPYERERLELEDGDFLDLDWLRQGNRRLVILTPRIGRQLLEELHLGHGEDIR